jgi:hypothetical protein
MNGRPDLGTVVAVSIFVLLAGQVAVAQVEWTWGSLVVPPGPPGSWDPGGHVLGDVVFDGALYHMYLLGGEGADPLDYSWSVGHWTSPDKVYWTPDPENPVLAPTPGAWDEFSIIHTSVLFDGAVFHMWYGATAVSQTGVNAGYATNQTGFGAWDKIAGPLPGLGPGIPAAWNNGGPSPSTVLFDGSTHGMWFTSSEGAPWGTWRIGYAASTDGGLNWTCHQDPVLQGQESWEGVNLYFPEVVPYGDRFAMWYTGASASSAQIGYAESRDGLAWERWPGNPVLSPNLPACNRAHSIAVILEGDTAHGWFSHCNDIWYATAPMVLFADDFETGTTNLWSLVLP